MCKIGDIILINDPIRENKHIGRHSFVVIDDTGGQIKSVDFDFVGLLMSSMDTKEKERRLMSYQGNFPIEPDAQDIVGGGNDKKACIKADQFYYFNKAKISYRVIGRLDIDVFNTLIDFINKLAEKKVEFQQIIDNT